MNIVWATSESVPYAKTGGLADVSSALPKALARRGHSIHVIMPYYPQQMAKLNLKFDAVHEMLGVPFGDANEWAQIRILKVEKNLTYCFIEFNRFYDRATLYDWNGSEYPDNAQRFIFFSRAVMQTVLALGLHGFRNFADCRSVMTIHNIGYQGVYDQRNLYWTGLGWEYFNFRCLEFYNRMNLLKGGIMCADMVSTVSPSYAEEILSPEYGFSLDSSLRHCAYHGRLRGILNGIDVSEWNPASDQRLPAVFSPDDMAGKAVCKAALQEHFGLPVRPDVPLFGVISRLAYQKGLDVFADSLEDMLYHDDSQFILIGSGDPWLQGRFSWLASKYPEKFAAYIGYASDKISHLLEAGSDFFVMPSRYEPCGLNQMYSMRYGTMPIVRSTGGLADTVRNYNADDPSASTGFVLWDLNPVSLRNTIRWAGDVYRKHPEAVAQLRRNGMTADFSWDNTASQYEKMYRDAHQ